MGVANPPVHPEQARKLTQKLNKWQIQNWVWNSWCYQGRKKRHVNFQSQTSDRVTAV